MQTMPHLFSAYLLGIEVGTLAGSLVLWVDHEAVARVPGTHVRGLVCYPKQSAPVTGFCLIPPPDLA
jgi:hypothetical protein